MYSYTRSRGLYAGVELVGQAFLCRWDENERLYFWPGVTQKDIVSLWVSGEVPFSAD